MAESVQQLDGSVATLAEAGDPATTIATVARTRGADLIAMATRGRGGFTRQLLGGVATATLKQASVPILLVPPAQPAR